MSNFTAKNENFTCQNCGKEVLALSVGYRNHCPFCLYSLHVDKQPGDRKNSCRGKMRPVSYEVSSKKGIVLWFVCLRCGEKKCNKAANLDRVQPDVYIKF